MILNTVLSVYVSCTAQNTAHFCPEQQRQEKICRQDVISYREGNVCWKYVKGNIWTNNFANMNYSVWMFVLFLVLSGKLTVTWDTGTPIHCSHLKNPSTKAVNHRFYARDSYPKSYQKKCISLLTSSDVIQQSYWCPGLIFVCKEMLKSHILLENGEDISPKSPLAMQNRF